MASSSDCSLCSFTYMESVKTFYKDDIAAIDFLKMHGVIPFSVNCPSCDLPCVFKQDQNLWCCNPIVYDAQKEHSICDFKVSAFKGSFISGSRLSPSQIVVLVSEFLSSGYIQESAVENLEIANHVDWKSFCSEVTDKWYSDQAPIGGVGVEVEIDETYVNKNNSTDFDLPPKKIWMFGGIERESKRHFLIPLTGIVEGKKDKQTLIPLIQKNIKEGSIIYSKPNKWGVFDTLNDLGYTHFHSKKNVSSLEKHKNHTQNIDQLWREVKKLFKCPEVRSRTLYQDIAKHYFIESASSRSSLLHDYFVLAGKLYPPMSNKERPIKDYDERSEWSDEDYN